MGEPWQVTLPSTALGKYVSQETLLTVLTTGSLRWSRPSTFNDPFDCQPRFTITPASDELVEKCVRELQRIVSDPITWASLVGPLGYVTRVLAESVSQGRLVLSDILTDFRAGVRDATTSRDGLLRNHHNQVVLELQDSKILCLTKAFDQTLMWSHYANSHSGALIIFAPISSDSQFRLAKPVFYSDDPLEFIEPDLLPKLLTGQITGSEPESTGNAMDRIVFTKAKSWSYEQEWRIFAGSGFKKEADFETNRFHTDDLIAVVFGAKYPRGEIEPFVQVASEYYPKANWFSTELSKSSMNLHIQRIE